MQKLLKFYFRHKKLCLAVMFFTIAAVVFVLPHTAFAAAGDEEDSGSIVRDINQIFNQLLRISSAWLWPVLIMTGSLLDNDLIFGGAMGERLLDIWVQIRNLVNIAFVLILLAIAVYNVLGLGEEGGGLPLAFKTAIPKFVLALIAVNFSFLAVKVVLDFTNVITGAVFALPTNAITQEKQDFKSEFEKTICGVSSDEMPLRPMYCDGESFNAKAQSFFSRLDRSNITLVYALRFGKAANLKFIRNDLQDIGQLGFNIIFNSILYIVYAVSFIVLFLVLLLRIVSLWVIVVLSPLIALGIVLPNLKELAGEGSSLQEKFLNDAIAPIKIGLVLSVSYIMLTGFEADKSIHGESLSSSTLSAVDINSIPTDIADLQQLLIAVAMVVIVWVGVFSAAEKSTAKGLTGWIKGHLETAGKFMAGLPAYIQAIPVGGKHKGKMSLSQIGGTLMQPFKNIERAGRYREPGMGGDTLRSLGKDGNLSGYMDQIKSTPGGLATKEGVEGLVELLDKKGQGNIARQIKSMDPAKDTGRIVDAIYKGTGEVSTAFRNFKTKEALIDEINRDKAASSGAGKEAEGKTGPSAKEVAADLSDKDAKKLKIQPEFKKLSEADIDELKDELRKIDGDKREGVIVIKTDGTVDKEKTMKKIEESLRSSGSSPGASGTGGSTTQLAPTPAATPEVTAPVVPPAATPAPAAAAAPATPAAPAAAPGAAPTPGGTPAGPPP